MIITSVNNEHIKEINKLKEKKYRDMTNTFLIEGQHLVKEALSENLLKEIITTEEPDFTYNGNITYVTENVMKKLSSLDSPPKIMGVAYKKTEEKIGKKVLVLEDIQDPGNVGTIIRSAVAFGIDTLVLSPKCADLYNSKTIRSSKGMLFHLNVIGRELLSFVLECQKNGYKIFGTKVDNGEDIQNIKIPEKFLLIMGNEGQGMSMEMSKMCDSNIYIKMSNQVESLNVAVATSIILYEVNKHEFN